MALSQSHFRFGINELAESTHGWHAAEDVNITFGVTTTFLLRFCIQADATGLNNVDYEFQYNLNGAGWVNITTSSPVVKAVTSVLSNGTACTERLSGTGGFTGGAGQTTDGTSGGTAHDIANNGSGETEASLQVNAGTVNPGDIIQFRVTRDVGNLLDTYAAIPALTVAGDPSVPPRALAAVLGLVLLAWQPMAPALLPRVEIAPTIAQDVTADAPPVRDRRLLSRIIAQWWKPILHGTSGDAAPAVVADVPPPKSDALPRILANWAPSAPLLPRRPAVVPGSVDQPPPRLRIPAAAIAATWAPATPLPPRPPPLIQGAPTVANDPPFDSRRSSFTPIYQAWKWRPVGAGTAAAVVADVPPLRAPSRLEQILARWVLPPPVAQVLRDVATLPGASVDPPPGRRPENRVQEIGWQPAPLQVVYVSRLVFEYTPDDPPFGLSRLLGPIHTAWFPASPAPQWGRHVPVTEVLADVPPVIGTARAQQAAGLSSWQAPPALPPRAPIVLPPSVDPPPPTSEASAMARIAGAWQPAPPSAQAGAHVPVSTLSVNDPPFGSRPPSASILSAWVPGPPAPHLPLYLIQPSAAEAVNDPPFGQRPWLLVSLGGWQLPPPLPWRPTWLAQGGVAVVDAPPSGLDTALSPILSAWQPAFVLPPRRVVQVPAEVVPELPPSGHPALPSILAAWQPPSTLPLLRGLLSPGIPGQSVDAPPIGFRLPLRWPPPPPDPPQPRAQIATLPGASVDPPSPSSRALMATLRAAWEPGPPAAQWGRHVPPSVAHVPVNDPPFGIRPWLPTVRARWEPGPPAPLLRLVVATESGPVNQVDFMYAGPITMVGAGAAAVASQLAGSGRITSQRAGGGPILGDGG